MLNFYIVDIDVSINVCNNIVFRLINFEINYFPQIQQQFSATVLNLAKVNLKTKFRFNFSKSEFKLAVKI